MVFFGDFSIMVFLAGFCSDFLVFCDLVFYWTCSMKLSFIALDVLCINVYIFICIGITQLLNMSLNK